VRSSKFPLVPFVLNFGIRLIFLSIHSPLVSTHRPRADHANPTGANGKHHGQKPTSVGLSQRFIVYAYVLMSNHVHMLIETGTTPLSRLP
jgi:hypothetical protein